MLMKPQFFYDHTTKQALGFQNPFYLKKAQQLKPKLYDGNVIKNTSAIHGNTSLKKLKHHLAGFDVVVKERTTATVITEGSWRFEHTKACFRDEIIPFVKALKDLFNTFDQYLIDELSEVQNVFHRMEQSVEQHRLESKMFEVKMNQVLNEKLLEQVINKDILNIIMNSSMDNAYVNVHECEKCLKLEAELLNKKDFIEKSHEKDTVIKKLKEIIKSLSGYMNEDKIKKDIEEIETINIELKHRVSKLIAENEHLKQTYKQLYDSIKPTRIRSKEQCDALVSQVNQKTAHSDYLKHTQEEAVILREIVEQGKSQNPLNNSLDFAYTVKFGNDHVVKILGYGDYQIGNVTISRVYYVEGLGHNLFSVGQFCDSNLEVAFRQHTCFIRNLEGVDLLTRS
ncbi:hypothetical protein Tco_0173109 [Tanacetum coccineum]